MRDVFLRTCYNHQGIRLMTRLLGLSHLRENKFNHNFQNCINPLCSCGMDIESTFHFSLHCPLFDEKKNHSPEHSKQNWLQINRGEWIFSNRNATVWQFIVWLEKNSLILNAPLITFYLLSTKIRRSLTLTSFNNYH